MPEVSVIVPVYKVEPYLHRCIDSILGQTFTDFELILVDDGSPDNCGKICDEYAKKDGRVRVVHKENGGVSSARNTGLQIACGKFIYFCDSDDYVEKELLNDTVQAMDGYDLVSFNRDVVDICGRCIKPASDYHVQSERWNDLEYKSRSIAFDVFRWKIGRPVWGQLYRKSIIDQNRLRFPENVKITEDYCFLICYLIYSDSVRTIPGVYYHYVKHPGSTMDEQWTRFNFDNNNEISKVIYYHLLQCPEQAMLKQYYPIIHYSVMNNVIKRARSTHPTLDISGIRSALLDEIQDTEFFLSQAAAFVGVKHLVIRSWGQGLLGALKALSEWSYYLDGNEHRLRIRTFILFSLRAARRSLALPVRSACHVLHGFFRNTVKKGKIQS